MINFIEADHIKDDAESKWLLLAKLLGLGEGKTDQSNGLKQKIR
jgi:hypothetical protein